jgi:hypothetical protein
MSTIHCALCSTFATKYRAEQPVCAMSTLVLVKSSIITFVAIQASIFNCTYLRCYWWRVDKSKLVIRHICWQIQGTSAGLRYVNSRAQSNSMLQLVCILRFLQSFAGISDAILDMSTIQFSLNSTFAAKCSLNTPHYGMLTLDLVKSNKITVLLMQSSIFNWTYLHCNWFFID